MSKTYIDTTKPTLPEEVLMSRIYVFRDHKVMLDRDLAELYGVETKQLKRQVRRNLERFPIDFMFELSEQEHQILRSQIGTLRHGAHAKYLPMVFTEHGVLMLSSVLNSNLAISVNIQIMRIFTRMRQFLHDTTQIHLELAEVELAVENLSKKQDGHDKNIELIFSYIDQLEEKVQKPTIPEHRQVGFKVGKEK